jgi:hypothetical protein
LGSVHIVSLTPELLKFAVAGERDPLAAEMAEGDAFAARAVNPWAYALLGRERVLAAGSKSRRCSTGSLSRWPPGSCGSYGDSDSAFIEALTDRRWRLSTRDSSRPPCSLSLPRGWYQWRSLT